MNNIENNMVAMNTKNRVLLLVTIRLNTCIFFMVKTDELGYCCNVKVFMRYIYLTQWSCILNEEL